MNKLCPMPGCSVERITLAVLREGAKRMLMQAIEAEVEAFLARHGELVDAQGRRRVVRNGHAPERQIQTGIGPIEVRRPRVRDCGAAAGAVRRSVSRLRSCQLTCGARGTSR